MTLISLLILIVLGLVGGFLCLMLLACALEALPYVLGALVCLWALNGIGCI